MQNKKATKKTKLIKKPNKLGKAKNILNISELS